MASGRIPFGASFSSLRGVIERFRAQLSPAGRSAHEQSFHLIRATGLIVVPTLLVATLVLAAAQRFLPPAVTAAWIALVVAGCTSAVALSRHHGSSRISASPPAQIVTALLLGAPWAALPLLFSFTPPDHIRVITVAVATMMAASGSLFFAQVPLAAVCYIAVVLLPCIAQLWFESTTFLHIAAALESVYFLGLVFNIADRARIFGEVVTARNRLQVEVAQRRLVQNQLSELIRSDPLTRLANRSAILDRTRLALETARRDGHSVALFLADIDYFKEINDTFGHPIGDAVLQQVAFRLNRAIRPTDLAARLGGDEFAVLLTRLSRPQDAAIVAERILDGLREPMAGAKLFVSMTLGIAASGGQDETPESLFRKSDAALYQAKDARRGTFFVFDSTTDAAIERRKVLQRELDRAIRDRKLCLHYQPIMDIVEAKTVRLEALLRWQHPERGNIPPSEFIPVAEASGIIHNLGNFVIEEACRLHHRLDAEGLPGTRICINVSINQLKVTNFAAGLEHILAREGVAANRFEIEITEDAIIDDRFALAEKLAALRSQEFTISIDDFGTGNASIARLRKFPVDCLKIDRSLIQCLESSPADAAIVRSIIMLGQSLDVDVVAEGVETRAQLAILRKFGCRLIQGYLFAKPMDGENVVGWLASASSGDKAVSESVA